MPEQVTTDHAWLRLDDRTLAVYNAWDTHATARLVGRLHEELAATGNLAYYEHELWPTVPAVLDMQRRGLPVDLGVKTTLRRRLRAEVKACDAVLHEASGRSDWNPNSDTQIRRWLFGGDRKRAEPGSPVTVNKGVELRCLGLKPGRKTQTGLWSVNQDALHRVLASLRKQDEPLRPILYALTHRARYVKLDEYLDFDWEERGDGPRMYPSTKLAGTESLRLTYADPPLHSWAEELRVVVRAPAGRCFVKADYSQLQARIAAYLSEDETDIAVYERTGDPPYKYHPDWDIHSQTVLDCFPDLRERWADMGAERELYRNWAKTFRYGVLLFGGEPETAQTRVLCPCEPIEPRDGVPGWTRHCALRNPPTLGLSLSERRRIADGWFSRHLSFVRWRQRLLAPFSGPHATHSLTTPFGWRRVFLSPLSSSLEREVFCWPIQTTESHIKLRAARLLHEAGVPLVLDHHDALMAEVAVGDAPQVAATMKATMERPVPELGGVCFPVEVSMGQSWGDLH